MKLNKRSLKRRPKRTRLVKTTAGWMFEEQLEKASKFDPQFRATVRPGKRTAILLGCPRGTWDPKTKRCRVGTRGYLKVKALTPSEAAKHKAKGVPVVIDRRAGMARLRRQAATSSRSMKPRVTRKPYPAAKTGRGKVSRNAKRVTRSKRKARPKRAVRPKRKVRPKRAKRTTSRRSKNFLLMTVSNPTTAAVCAKAKRAFKKWHLKGPSFASTVKNVPDHYPNNMINLGVIDYFTFKAGGKEYKWTPPGKRPIVAADPAGNRAFILSGDFSDFPKGAKMTEIFYCVYLPPRSNRIKYGGPHWRHPFKRAPIIHPNKGGGCWMRTPVKPEGFDG